MASPKDILVSTTSSFEGIHIKKYIKPISAHIVAGTNLFSDFFASFTDVFGGRSSSYQKQLRSLYNEAIERLKITAYEVGANCIVGLKIDMDEISGKNKSMFMLTAIGTAVVVEMPEQQQKRVVTEGKFENIGVDRINALKTKREIVDKANSHTLSLNEETWNFITTNQVFEIYDYILTNLKEELKTFDLSSEQIQKFLSNTKMFVDALPSDRKVSLIYNSILEEKDTRLLDVLFYLVKELQLLELEIVQKMLTEENFQIQKRALRLLKYDKPFYNKGDIEQLAAIEEIIKSKFPERGTRSMKKQLLSSKEKEVWACECGKSNDIGMVCTGCTKDIYGFYSGEMNAHAALETIADKTSLINEYLV
ncbi:MAG: hypothetical protein JWQ30_904 [Sediminibacterium sp.]|nr:hypothetical protein [Sediminibacterium sp.]